MCNARDVTTRAQIGGIIDAVVGAAVSTAAQNASTPIRPNLSRSAFAKTWLHACLRVIALLVAVCCELFVASWCSPFLAQLTLFDYLDLVQHCRQVIIRVFIDRKVPKLA